MNYFPNNYQNMFNAIPQMINNNQNNSNGIIWVQGDSGAKSYPIAPNNTVILMDSENDRFFIKSADQSGMPTLRKFSYKEESNEMPTSSIATQFDMSNYITKEEFEKRISELGSNKPSKKEVTNV